MAGLYIHIPFCTQKCSYCDFHFSTELKGIQPMLSAMERELELRSNELKDSALRSIYLGGGTPSLLDNEQLSQLLDAARAHYSLDADIEITLEANPENLHADRLDAWRALGVNRLSIGLQSFDDELLRLMNRAHDAQRAHDGVKAARAAGFDNISVDIIYGLPYTDTKAFRDDLQGFLDMEPEHISAYTLTIEPRTKFHHMREQGSLTLPDEDMVADQFLHIRDTLADYGYEQYEVSNFAKPGRISRHNSAYWEGRAYIGIGPSAHSYIADTRSWNVANNARYLQALSKGEWPSEQEKIDDVTRYNEYLLTRLRTKWGIDLQHIKTSFQRDLLQQDEAVLAKYKGTYHILDEHLILNADGLLLADRIASELFI